MDLAEGCPAPEEAVLSVLETACLPYGWPIPVQSQDSGVSNKMEACFIRKLHAAFESEYGEKQNITVLSKANSDDRWGRSEFLHDITVLERTYVRSSFHEILLPVARRILWQVESEFSNNGRDIAIDFSKLIAGSAENKLLIIRQPIERQVDGKKRYLRFVEEMAATTALSGNVFLAFLPAYSFGHPHLIHWGPDASVPHDVGRLRDGKFQPLKTGWADWPSSADA